MTKKLKLSTLKVQSFVIDMSEKQIETAKGGYKHTGCISPCNPGTWELNCKQNPDLPNWDANKIQ